MGYVQKGISIIITLSHGYLNSSTIFLNLTVLKRQNDYNTNHLPACALLNKASHGKYSGS